MATENPVASLSDSAALALGHESRPVNLRAGFADSIRHALTFCAAAFPFGV
ncbi:hypothetical protein [Gemmobacter denitrificans]|uniref:Uncharacterized protein n=1 Tax=Gemmobacter denitrificans TaxID=3123040 RepID=A0ABU8BXI0_9RHOB